MKYTKEERLEIGRKIYHNELTRYEAAELYGVNHNTARDYMRLYRDINNLPPKHSYGTAVSGNTIILPRSSAPEYVEYTDMTKEELIHELIKMKINEARLKKGYEVKGVGANKEFIPIDNKNMK